jgi:DeoR family transcriptional regulator, fructose operon transcriptional repressor
MSQDLKPLRQARIERILAERRWVTVGEIAEMSGVSSSTVRRDLNELARMSRLTRVRGGATRVTRG